MKKSNGEAIAKVLSTVANAIESLDEADLESLLSGDLRFEIVAVTSKQRHGESDSAYSSIDSAALDKLARLLQDADDRSRGWEILEEHTSNKDSLIQLARHLDLPCQKKESVDRLKEKIIEATIGFRLRSAAIRGGEKLEKSAG